MSELKEGYAPSHIGWINRLLTLLIIMLIVGVTMSLSGCDTMPKKEPVVPPKEKIVLFDASLLTECEGIPPIQNPVTDTQLNEWIKRWAKIHVDCATNKSKLNAEVRKAFNIPVTQSAAPVPPQATSPQPTTAQTQSLQVPSTQTAPASSTEDTRRALGLPK